MAIIFMTCTENFFRAAHSAYMLLRMEQAAATTQVFAAARDGNVVLVKKCIAACANVDGNRDEVN